MMYYYYFIFTVVISSYPLLIGATWSIAATDNVTRQVGGAGASCVSGVSIFDLYSAVPGLGVLHAQAIGQNKTSPPVVMALKLLRNETNPSDVIDVITTDQVDPGLLLEGYPNSQMRQYGIVDMKGRAAGYTGSKLEEFYVTFLSLLDTAQVDTQGGSGNVFTYSAQGNVVTNETVSSVAKGFLGLLGKGMGCDLADRLMIAVEAGGAGGAGDKRCLNDNGTPAAGAFLHVDNADGTVLVHIDIVGNGTSNPLLSLREQYDEWRALNPCPTESLGPTSTPSAGSPFATSGVMDIFMSLQYGE